MTQTEPNDRVISPGGQPRTYPWSVGFASRAARLAGRHLDRPNFDIGAEQRTRGPKCKYILR